MKTRVNKANYCYGVVPERNKFIVQINVNKIKIVFRRFDNEVDAAIKYDEFVKSNGLNRRLNFPDPEPENLIPNTRLVRLTKGQFAVVDEEDFEWLNQYDWCARLDNGNYYAARSFLKNGRQITRLMHVDIMGGADMVDHINHNGIHNYRSNLRECTRGQNNMNVRPRKNVSSKYKGVCYSVAERKYKAKIDCNRVRYNLGTFSLEEDAAKVYDAKAKELFGEFAYLNFPNE